MGLRWKSKSAAENSEAAHKDKSVLREYAEAVALAVLLALFIRAFVVQAFKIPSGSMLPTLKIGDHILVNKFIYGIRLPVLNRVIIPISKPERGDVIVFIYPLDPDKDFIKRVVGVAGDRVEIREKKLYVNGKLVPDRYSSSGNPSAEEALVQPRDNFGPVTVPRHKVFVMGDNRDHSYDSRFWGFVDLDAVRGEAFITYWSWDRDSWRVRWDRIGMLVQ